MWVLAGNLETAEADEIIFPLFHVSSENIKDKMRCYETPALAEERPRYRVLVLSDVSPLSHSHTHFYTHRSRLSASSLLGLEEHHRWQVSH